jgi:uncharacterized protein (DUF2336 family)
MTGKLTNQDLERLLTDPSAENRAATAAKIAGEYHDGAFGPAEREIALEIFSIMVEDAEARVRAALAEHLKDCADISHDLVLRLARDEDAIARPMLRSSELLTDEDLIEIIRSSGESKQGAIAERRTISEKVTETLVEQGNARVVAKVMENPGAAVSESAFGNVLDRHGNVPAVTGAVTRRGLLPLSVAERLVSLAAQSLEQQLAADSRSSNEDLSDLVLQVRERATLSLVDPRFGIGDAQGLVRALAEHGRLTPSIILRGVCMGDLAFFEAALAHIARLPLLNVQVLAHDEGRRGLQALWDKAHLPVSMFPVALAAVEVADEVDFDGEPHDRERYRRRIIERVLTRCAGAGVNLAGIDSESLDYLLDKLSETADRPRRAYG